ncbi:efflux RND transporter permease subunit [Lacicoccus alkaliphilus]|uniref:Multidrug efflux pump subunit AcrB n=1 Tax=Lacicoccus alkaliphilus DSM 16010 TaxID=1123231 RepID=A0A1M7H8R3_9BACL|nr:efflux RND transporter permease subunit [Salinicoccus alkaliphilus]SHM24818.1 Multidrug efflux pump subunit AcrB [Salinicoccus alkaliphilus DSM 16010]
MKNIFQTLLERSRLIVILIFTIALMGIYTFLTIENREIPEIEVNVINITTPWPGADRADVETNITNVIEGDIFGIEGLESVSSVSQDDVSVVTLELTDDADPDQVENDINNLLGQVGGDLPENAAQSQVDSVSNAFPLISYIFQSENGDGLDGLRSQVEDLALDVTQMEGVNNVTVKGYDDQTVNINLDREALEEEQITPDEIIQEIDQSFTPVVLGTRVEDEQNIRLSFQDTAPLETFENIRVGEADTLLTDIAEIERVPDEREDIVEHMGEEAVSFTVFLSPGEDVPSTSEDVEAVVEQHTDQFDDNISISVISSERENVEDIFEGLYISLLIALIAVIIGTSLGLSFIGSAVVMTTVVLSILIGLIPVPWMGVDLNQISVIGLIIALGILVDDSIVVNDNIERRLVNGDSKSDAMYNGVREVAPSVIASTIAIVLAFSPLLLLSGANGEFIRALPSILITTIIVSTVLALVLVPALRYLAPVRKVPEDAGVFGKTFTRLSGWYADKLVPKFIKRPVITFIIVLIISTLSLGLFRFTPFEFFPEADRSEVTVDIIYENGQTIEETHERANDVVDYLDETVDNLEGVTIFTGDGLPNLFGASLDQSGSHTAQLALYIDKEQMSASQVIDTYEEELREAFPEADIFMETIVQGPPEGAPVTLDLSNDDLGVLEADLETIRSTLEGEGAIVTSNLGRPVDTVTYSIDEEALEDAELSISQVKNELNLLGQGVPVQEIIVDDEQVQSNMKYADEFTLEDIEIIKFSGDQPETFPLEDFVSTDDTNQYQAIAHENGDRQVAMEVYNLEEERVEEIVDGLSHNLADSTGTVVGGEATDQTDFFVEIGVLFAVIVVLVYLVIAFEFNSLVLPLIIVFSIFLSISGGFIGLFVTQTPLSFMGVMGMVSLAGIVVRNAVVLVDFIEARRKDDSMDINEAIIESGRARLRPIILTTITTIIALLPIALGGDALFEPLAVTIIAGIAFSSILSLIVTPSLYMIYYRLKYKN